MDSRAFQVQQQIRENAQAMQTYLRDLNLWETNIKKKEKDMKKKAREDRRTISHKSASRQTNVRVQVTSLPGTKSSIHPLDSPKRIQQIQPVSEKPILDHSKTLDTTASQTREYLEQQDGNSFYKKGDFLNAVKCYTRCLGYNSSNSVVLSNRAMTYIKLHEYSKARDDCTAALKLDCNHIKSWSRRGTANNALGCHRNALLDFEKALELEPHNRQIKVEIRKTRELMKSAIKRTPKHSIEICFSGIESNAENQQEFRKIDDHEWDTTIKKDSKDSSKENFVENSKLVNQSKPGSSSISKSSSVTYEIPLKPPKTCYEFLTHWKCISSSEEKQFNYLKMLKPSLIPKLFKDSMEIQLLIEILLIIKGHFTPDMTDIALDILENIAKVTRFDIMKMFFTDENKKTLTSVFNQLETCCVNDRMKQSSDQRIEVLRQKYGLL